MSAPPARPPLTPPGTVSGGDGSASPPPALPAPESEPLRLPPHTSRLSRIAEYASGAASDLQAMAALRAKLVRLEAAEKVRVKQNAIEARAQAYAEAYVPPAILVLAGAILLLIAFGFLFSAGAWSLFGWSPLWSLAFGFTLACVILVVVGAIWYKAHTPVRVPVDLSKPR